MPTTRPGRAKSAGARSVAVLLVLAVVAPALLFAGGARGTSGGCSYVNNPYGIVANVTWNGQNVCEGGTSSSAFSVDLTKTIGLLYSWLSPTINVNDARLQMFYFGFAVATRDVQLVGGPGNGPGGILPAAQTVPMNWTPGAIAYVLSGAYSLSASLVAPNGTTVFSEHFYVHANAPFVVGAVLPILLIAIAAWEVYNLATSGRAAALGRTARTQPPPSPSAPGPATEAPAEEPAEESPPPSSTEES